MTRLMGIMNKPFGTGRVETQTRTPCTAIHFLVSLTSRRHRRPVYTPFHAVPTFLFFFRSLHRRSCPTYLFSFVYTKGSRPYQTWSRGATRRGSTHSLPRLPCSNLVSAPRTPLLDCASPKCRLGFVWLNVSIAARLAGEPSHGGDKGVGVI